MGSMVDFAQSLQRGMEAAQAADRNRSEIREVFRDLNQQLTKGFEGLVQIGVIEFIGFDGQGNEIARSFVQGAVLNKKNCHSYKLNNGDIADKRLENELGNLVAYYSLAWENQAIKDLGVWKIGKDGYPCKISLSRREYVAEDAEALQSMLAEILAQPEVGEKIFNLMQEAKKRRDETIQPK